MSAPSRLRRDIGPADNTSHSPWVGRQGPSSPYGRRRGGCPCSRLPGDRGAGVDAERRGRPATDHGPPRRRAHRRGSCGRRGCPGARVAKDWSRGPAQLASPGPADRTDGGRPRTRGDRVRTPSGKHPRHPRRGVRRYRHLRGALAPRCGPRCAALAGSAQVGGALFGASHLANVAFGQSVAVSVAQAVGAFCSASASGSSDGARTRSGCWRRSTPWAT